MTNLKIAEVKFVPGEDLGDFHEAVRKIQRPYQEISQKEYATLKALADDASSDVFAFKGRYWTFGNADGGVAMMPIKPTYVDHLPLPALR